MSSTSVTSKGQVTIPKEIRQQLGIRKGTRIHFEIVGDHNELHIAETPSPATSEGFGMLKSDHEAVPPDFDPATLLKNGNE